MLGVNPYSPYGYMPPMSGPGAQQSSFQAPGMSQPFQTPQPAQAQQSGPDWVQVPTVQQVEQVQVQPGGKAWVMVQNEPIFALRTADNMGLVTTDYYRFEKVDPGAAAPAADYVTRAEFEKFVASLSDQKKEGVQA